MKRQRGSITENPIETSEKAKFIEPGLFTITKRQELDKNTFSLIFFFPPTYYSIHYWNGLKYILKMTRYTLLIINFITKVKILLSESSLTLQYSQSPPAPQPKLLFLYTPSYFTLIHDWWCGIFLRQGYFTCQWITSLLSNRKRM